MARLIKFHNRRARGWTTIEYMAMAVALITMLVALTGRIRDRVGADGRPGSVAEAVRTQWFTPAANADDLF